MILEWYSILERRLQEWNQAMAGSLLDRALSIVELLAAEPGGLQLQEVAGRLDLPKSAVHRLLAELIRLGYARRASGGGYLLTAKIVTLGHAWLSASGVTDLVQPTLDRLAAETGELARYAVVDGDRLTWIAKAQGARFGLRLDPDQGMEAVLYCTATGHAWLATLSDEEALQMVARQGFGRLQDDGPNAPRSIDALRNRLTLARSRGYAWVFESSAPGTASVAAAVRPASARNTAGVVTVSGPSVRLTEERMHALAPRLLDAAAELSALSPGAGAAPAGSESPIGRGGLAISLRRPR